MATTSGPGPSKRAKLCSSQSILDYFNPSSTGSNRHVSQQENSDRSSTSDNDVEMEGDELSEESSDDETAKSSDTEGRSTAYLPSVTPTA